MPREYSNRPTGPRTPEPLSFGASDINLQTPQFRAQTNVDPGVNVFGQLQEIIGAAVGVAKQRIDMDTNELRNKISYENAVAAESERTSREKTVAFTAEYAARREVAASSNDVEALAGVERELVTILQDPSTDNETKIAAAQQLQATGVDSSRIKADARTEERSRLKSSIDAAVARNDFESLETMKAEFVLAQKEGRLTEAQVELFNHLNSAVDMVSREATSALRSEENMAAAAIKDTLSVYLKDLSGRLEEDREYLVKLAGSGADIAGVLFDTIRDGLIDKYPDMAELMYYTGEVETAAVAREIRKTAVDLAGKAIDQRTAKNRADAYESAIINAETAAIDEGIVSALNYIESNPNISTTAARSEAVRRASNAYVDAGASEVDRLVRAQNLADNPITNAEGNRLYDQQIKAIRSRILQTRDGTRDINDVEIGFTKQYPTPESFRDHVLESFGYTASQAESGEVPGRVLESAYGLMKQYETDYNARTAAAERQRKAAMAADKQARKEISAKEIWEATPLYKLTQDRQKLSTIPIYDLQVMVSDATVGYKNNEVPDQLVNLLKGSVTDPNTFPLHAAFWSQYSEANQRLALQVATDDDLRMSMMVGLAFTQDLERNVDRQIATSNAVTMIANLNPNSVEAFKLSESEKQKIEAERTRMVENVAASMAEASSIVLDGSVTQQDDVDVSLAMLADNLEGHDRMLLNSFILSALAHPSREVAASIAFNMMRRANYDLVIDEGRLNMVYNIPISDDRPEDRVLPGYGVMKTPEWAEYVRSKKATAASWISSNEQHGFTIAEGDLNSISIRFSDIDISNDRSVGVTVTVGPKNTRIDVPASVVKINSDDFKAWMKTRVARETKTDFLLPAVSIGR